MSAILGIVNFDGKPVTEAILEKMMTAMAYWGPHGRGTWKQGTVGLGHLLLHNTPESLHEKLPAKSRCGNYVITSRARIDNREELLKAFDVPPLEYANTPDSALILEAYRKWGEECPHRLLGDWVFAIRDAGEQKLFIARDHQGTTGLYYYHGPRFFAFSSGLKGLLALADIPRRLNELQVARALTGWHEHGPSTVYEGIFRLPPAHAVTITPKEVKIKRYWYLEHTPRLRFKRDEDYVEAFLEIYREAVRCRLRSAGKVGITLSGGLDSGSAAALAARELQEKGKPLPAFSAVPLYDIPGSLPPDRSDETPYIKATAGYVGNIDLNLIRSEHKTPLQGIEKGLEIHDEPVHAVNNQYWMFSLWEAARDRGVGTMLTGMEGNFTISWNGRGYLAQLARQMRWITLHREFRAWRNTHPAPLLRAIKEQVIKPLTPLTIKNWLRCLRGGSQPWENYSPISMDFANRIRLAKEMVKKGHDPAFGMTGDCRKLRYKGIRPGRSMVGCRLQQSGAGFALEIRDPTMDRRVLEFCLAIPDNQFIREGNDRFLIRRAMHGLLPQKVLMNRKRGLQAPDIAARLRQSSGQIREALMRIQKESRLAAQFLDIKKMGDALSTIEHEVNLHAPQPTSAILLRGLMTGLFLYGFETRALLQ
jgi:asparagine synthase (glutamine-hydrolysing)